MNDKAQQLCSQRQEGFFYVLWKGGAFMYFTEGRLRSYECMMQEKPKYENGPVKTMQDRDCQHCLHYNKQLKKCSKEKCVIFKD
jgi:hypothetical protein